MDNAPSQTARYYGGYNLIHSVTCIIIHNYHCLFFVYQSISNGTAIMCDDFNFVEIDQIGRDQNGTLNLSEGIVG